MAAPGIRLDPILEKTDTTSPMELDDIINQDDGRALIRYVREKPDRVVQADSEGKTLIIWLVIGGAYNCVSALLELDSVNINHTDKTGSNCLHYASSSLETIKLAHLLVQRGANPLIKNSAGWSSLHHAVHLRSQELVSAIELSPFAKPETQEVAHLFTRGTFTPLHLAGLGPLKILDRLVQIAKLHLTVEDELGMTLLHHVVLGEDPVAKIRSLSYHLGCCVNVCDKLGRTPLSIASQAGMWGVANLLVDMGASPNTGVPVPLLHAYLTKASVADSQNAKLHFRKLLDAKATPDVAIGRYTLLDLAQALDDQEMVQLLVTFGAKKSQAFLAMKKSEEKRRSNSFLKYFQSSSCGGFSEEELKQGKHISSLHELVIKEINFESLAKYTKSSEWEGVNQQGETPFLYCCRRGTVENGLWLLECTVNARAVDSLKNNALHISLASDNLLLFYCLVKRFPELVNGINQAGKTPLEIAFSKGLHTAVDLLLRYGADVTRLGPQENSVIHQLIDACTTEDLQKQFLPVLNKLVVTKGLIDGPNRKGDTPLLYSWTKTRMIVFNRLVELGADTEVRDAEKKTCLVRAAEGGNFLACRTLVRAGATRDAQGLIAACIGANLQVVELLFDKTIATGKKKATIANPNTGFPKLDGVYSTPLTASIAKVYEKKGGGILEEQDEYKIFLRLLQESANPNKSIKHTRKRRATPLTLCAEYNLPLLARLLLEHKAKPNKTPKHSDSPLQLACKHNHPLVVEELVKGGAEVDKDLLERKDINEGVKAILRQKIQRKRSDSAMATLVKQPSINNLKDLFESKKSVPAGEPQETASNGSDSSRSRSSGKYLLSPRTLSQQLEALKLQGAEKRP